MQQKRKKTAQRRFRSSMVPIVRDMVARGRSLEEIADHFKVDTETIAVWSERNEKFAEAVRRGRDIRLEQVVASLFRRATGYEYEEVKQHAETVQGPQGEEVRRVTRMEKIVKHIPADFRCAEFLLRKLRPGHFGDESSASPGEEHISYDVLAIEDEPATDTREKTES